QLELLFLSVPLPLHSTLPLSRIFPTAAISKGKEGKWIEEEKRIQMRCVFDVGPVFPISCCCPRLGERPRW
ncbi:unnamed protein product, partial [Urochloa humidicola]